MSGWKPTANNLLKRIKLNSVIYGTELFGILSVEEKYIVNHFENKDGEWSWEQQDDNTVSAN